MKGSSLLLALAGARLAQWLHGLTQSGGHDHDPVLGRLGSGGTMSYQLTDLGLISSRSPVA